MRERFEQLDGACASSLPEQLGFEQRYFRHLYLVMTRLKQLMQTKKRLMKRRAISLYRHASGVNWAERAHMKSFQRG